ncbi:unnamed protein product [Didymodactylos carnosus]|uniref:Peptidase S8/S53 domain-containing protein n=1 Tax=Didymodactylos carnosus TaxID=1234261 RepID=A0A8S2DZ95_9BILA|nr:unnamed protein product [Didymodactylos carnosus]CAF3802208.1 unnamed protein product [Didymodactylos carnosus]
MLFPLLVVATVLISNVGAIKAHKKLLLAENRKEGIDHSYLVIFKSHENAVEFRDEHLLTMGIQAKHLYAIGTRFVGYGAVITDKKVLDKILDDRNVQFVEQDQRVKAHNIQHNAPWHLARISDKGKIDNYNKAQYIYQNHGAKDVTAYVIDTGIRCSHEEFEDRCQYGFDATGEGNGDGNGHGTHVAGLIGSKTYGVAKKVSLIAVKVLKANGQGTSTDTVAGINWATKDYLSNGKTASVINMSLSGPKSPGLRAAILASVEKGLAYAVAAGNANSDACDFDPASYGFVVTVGATDLDSTILTRNSDDQVDEIEDGRSQFSNYGKCVKIFAPGGAIQSTWSTNDQAINTISGTSMASPIVAGAMALILQTHPRLSPAKLRKRLIQNSTKGVVRFDCLNPISFDNLLEEEEDTHLMDQQQQLEEENQKTIPEFKATDADEASQWLTGVESVFRKLNYQPLCWPLEASKRFRNESMNLWYEESQTVVHNDWDQFKQRLMEKVRDSVRIQSKSKPSQQPSSQTFECYRQKQQSGSADIREDFQKFSGIEDPEL